MNRPTCQATDAPAEPAQARTAAYVRHQLLTPINHIIGYSEMLEEDAVALRQESFVSDLQKIQSAARSLLGLLEMEFQQSPGHLDQVPKSHQREALRPNIAPESRGSTGTTPLAGMASGHVLIVDDVEANRDILARRLKSRGLQVETAENGRQALAALARTAFDAVLLDVLMPELDGYNTLLEIKQAEKLRDIPVIMISALDELDSVVRCIEAGAEDFLPKPFNPTLLAARLSACLEKKALRDAERRHLEQIEATQARLRRELAGAANYVRSLFPKPIKAQKGCCVQWLAVPSSELAGDAFGYHWIDDDHFAIYLLDVCGHGVRPCLLAASVLNVLRSGTTGAEMRNPAAVLTALNQLFPMEQHNNLYFTIWYGVYSPSSRQLVYGSAGHPDAIVLSQAGDGTKSSKRLDSTGPVIGAFDDSEFEQAIVQLEPGMSLLVMSDGCFEVETREGKMLNTTDLEKFFASNAIAHATPDDWYDYVRSLSDKPAMDDDFTMILAGFEADGN